MPQRKALEHLRAGRPQEAVESLKTYLDQHAEDAEGWFLLGASRHALRDLTGAADALSRSLLLDPSSIEANLAYVTVLCEAGHPAAALAAGQQALSRLPRDARIRYAIALCLEDLGRPAEALSQYDAALEVSPGFDDALHNRGLLLARGGRLLEAEENQRRYVAARPQSARAASGLVDVLISLGRWDEALAALQRLERLSPEDVSVPIRRGVVLASSRRFADAQTQFSDAGQRDPEAVTRYLRRVAPGSDPVTMLSPENIYFGYAWRMLGDCDWREWPSFAAEMRRAAADPSIAIEPAVAFMSRLLPLSGSERHAVCRRVAAPIEAQYPALSPQKPSGRARIRVGVLSPDFREHLNAYLLYPFFELLGRGQFEVHAYSLSRDDGSAIRTRIQSAADRFVDIGHLSDRDAALALHRDDLDILLDVGGHTTGARFAITAQRPARLQINYLGFSCSLASKRVDYAIVDRVVADDAAEWTEARAFLPATHFLYDFRGRAPDVSLSRRDYGLPEDAFVYCAFHRAEKISPDVFGLWMEILSGVPNGVLWFRALSEAAARNLRSRAAEAGIDPGRLVFAPFEPRKDARYLARHALGDLMLDSLHHNAMTTACDALGSGLPLITMPGPALASRASESMLRAAGMHDLVVADLDAYVRMAVRLGSHPEETRNLKRRLQDNRGSAPLFDTAARVGALESALRKMYERMARGEPPVSFDA